MAKQKRKNLVEREKSRKGNGTISGVQLASCYVASALIVVLCLVEAANPQVQAEGDPALYYVLAVLGIAFSLWITLKNSRAKKAADPGYPRLK